MSGGHALTYSLGHSQRPDALHPRGTRQGRGLPPAEESGGGVGATGSVGQNQVMPKASQWPDPSALPAPPLITTWGCWAEGLRTWPSPALLSCGCCLRDAACLLRRGVGSQGLWLLVQQRWWEHSPTVSYIPALRPAPQMNSTPSTLSVAIPLGRCFHAHLTWAPEVQRDE